MFHLTKNKIYQSIFFLLISVMSFFNAGNSNLYIQINFILFGIYLSLCLKDKNYFAHFKLFIIENKISFYLFLIFVFYLLFQILPLPIDLLKILANQKYTLLKQMNIDSGFFSINFAPSNGYFQIINYLSLFICIVSIKIIFYNNKHIYRFYFFISLLATFHSILAVILYLNGNPDLIYINNFYYKDSSTGLFVNRTIFSIFLNLSLICALEYLKNIDNLSISKKKDNFFSKIYMRIFILFITIGIITSFSKLGNFLMILLIFIYLINNFFVKKSITNFFGLILLFIIFLDVFIIGYFFGGEKIIERFMFLNEDFSLNNDENKFTRLEIISFSFNQIKDFLIFGYGAGGFENVFKLKFINQTNLYANHAHSDLIEFVGEFGLIGFIIFVSIFYRVFNSIKKSSNMFLSLLVVGLIILLFDFSLHIPLIQFMFVTLIALSLRNKKNNFIH